ncbi:hypothetical protein [Archangium sp. Cb G35]|uniref:hypothetical protein n=1 Tax=Archangium sp. Cb G35 TaxID=1920190 RepID=UPI0011610D14|nr:hypothetical protein [Archangium sp. Cb G35]
MRTVVPERLQRAREQYSAANQLGLEYPATVGALEELLPDRAALVLGFCDRSCERRYAERAQEARADT